MLDTKTDLWKSTNQWTFQPSLLSHSSGIIINKILNSFPIGSYLKFAPLTFLIHIILRIYTALFNDYSCSMSSINFLVSKRKYFLHIPVWYYVKTMFCSGNLKGFPHQHQKNFASSIKCTLKPSLLLQFSKRFQC
jgi:hypothetical protein